MRAEAFAEDELCVRDAEGGVKGGGGGIDEAMIWPEGLGAVGRGDDVVRGFVVGRGEGDVQGRVPVLGEDDVREGLGEAVDERDDFVSAGDGERAARHEVGLEIDEEQGGVLMVIHHWALMVAECGLSCGLDRCGGRKGILL